MSIHNKYQYIGNELNLFAYAKHWKKYFSGLIEDYIVGDVLEVGAGLGSNTFFLCDKTQGAWTCLEPDRMLLLEIQEKIKSGKLNNCNTFNGKIEDLPSKQSFDTIVYIDVLEHVENDSEELIRASKLLRGKGHLIIISPAHGFLFTQFDKSIGHYRRYSKKTLAKIIPNSCKKKLLYYVDSFGLFASFANKLFLKQSRPSLDQIKFWDNVLVPCSSNIDKLLFYSVGKSLIGIFEKEQKNETSRKEEDKSKIHRFLERVF